MCEDYPCCGHTDGLGCDWVSPNEVQLCLTCADARAQYPYHAFIEECPTARAKAEAEAMADGDFTCEDCGEDASFKWDEDVYLCADHYYQAKRDDAEWRSYVREQLS